MLWTSLSEGNLCVVLKGFEVMLHNVGHSVLVSRLGFLQYGL